MMFLIANGVPSIATFIQLVTECPGECLDLTDDDVVDVADILELLSQWGNCPHQGPCPADFNDDGVVDVADLLALLANFGPCVSCGGECIPLTLEDCWERYHDDIARYEECVEWVEEKDQYYPE